MVAAVLVPIITSIAMFAMIFGIVYLGSRERMAMIERGMNPYQKGYRPRHFSRLKNGLVLLGAGAGLLAAYIIDHFFLGNQLIITGASISGGDSDNPAIYFALVAMGAGLGLFASYRIEKKELGETKNNVQP